jgi:hypothetical protein
MDAQQILAHLQSQFPGQLVLYVDDLALILGKSNAAIRHLIERKRLPFQVKSIGGHFCVDVFQVAQWLASTPEAAEEVVAPETELPKPAVVKAPNKRLPKPRAQDKLPADGHRPPGTTPYKGAMIEEILKLRSDYVKRWSAAAASMPDSTERRFMQAVLEKVVTLPVPSDVSVFWCAVKHYEAELAGWRCVNQQLMHETLEHLRAALQKELIALRERLELDMVSIEVTQGPELVFSASRNLGQWTIFVDEHELIPAP